MASRWTDEEAIELIGLYKTYPLLWNSSHKLYKNAVARAHAYNAIVEKLIAKMGNPAITVQDVRSKIKNLRSSYYQEIKKQNRANQLGFSHKCTIVWFDYFKDIMNTIAHNILHSDKDKNPGEQQFDSEDSLDTTEEKPVTISESYIVSIKQEYLDELAKEDSKVVEVPDDYFDTITVPLPKKVKLENKYDTCEEETRAEVQNTGESDEFQIFANHVAQQLRNLPLDKALSIQVEIQALVAKERIDLFNKKDGND